MTRRKSIRKKEKEKKLVARPIPEQFRSGKPPTKPKKMTPHQIRKQIGELRQRIFGFDRAITHERNAMRLNQMIRIKEMLQQRLDHLFFQLHEAKESGEVEKEREAKRKKAWDEKQKQEKKDG